jgi:hypothetical protein
MGREARTAGRILRYTGVEGSHMVSTANVCDHEARKGKDDETDELDLMN